MRLNVYRSLLDVIGPEQYCLRKLLNAIYYREPINIIEKCIHDCAMIEIIGGFYQTHAESYMCAYSIAFDFDDRSLMKHLEMKIKRFGVPMREIALHPQFKIIKVSRF